MSPLNTSYANRKIVVLTNRRQPKPDHLEDRVSQYLPRSSFDYSLGLKLPISNWTSNKECFILLVNISSANKYTNDITDKSAGKE